MSILNVHSVMPESNLGAALVARKFGMAEGAVTTWGMINSRVPRFDYQQRWPWPATDLGLSEGEVTTLDMKRRATGWWDYEQDWPWPSTDIGLSEGEVTTLDMKRRATGWWDAEQDWPWPSTDIGLAGMGQSCDPYLTVLYGVCTSADTGGAYSGPAYNPPDTPVIVPSQSDPGWSAVVQQLIKQGFTLAQIQAIQPGTVVTGNQILRQTPGYPVSLPVTSTGLNLGANVSTGAGLAFGSTAILGLGLLALVLLAGRRS